MPAQPDPDHRPLPAPAESTWLTVPVRRRVLFIAHNLTTATRLLDVLPIFESDFRVQLTFTWPETDPFRHGLPEFLESHGFLTMPWAEACAAPFDLAITASHHAGIDQVSAPLVILSHGIGYTKKSPESRIPNPESRIRHRGPRNTPADPAPAPDELPPVPACPGEAHSAAPLRTGECPEAPPPDDVFGLSDEWVLRDGAPFAKALVFSHPEQITRLTPAARPAAVLAGDPCYDRILASRHLTPRYRAALAAPAGRTLIAVTSTWSPTALFATPDLIRRLLAELPADTHQLALILHPNIWHHHGPRQLHTWLADCLRAGLLLLPEHEGWRATLLAADLVIGDHGSVTCYAAALDRPVLLAAFPADRVAPGSPVARLGELAPHLDLAAPLRPQLERAIAGHRALAAGPVREPAGGPARDGDADRRGHPGRASSRDGECPAPDAPASPTPASSAPASPVPASPESSATSADPGEAGQDPRAAGRYAEVAELVTSAPGESARLLRALCYRLLHLPEPDAEPPVPVLPPPSATGALNAPGSPNSPGALVAAAASPGLTAVGPEAAGLASGRLRRERSGGGGQLAGFLPGAPATPPAGPPSPRPVLQASWVTCSLVPPRAGSAAATVPLRNAETGVLVALAFLSRHPAELTEAPDHAHLVVHADHPLPSLRNAADVLFIQVSELRETPEEWLALTLAARPGAVVAAVVDGRHCWILTRNGDQAVFIAAGADDPVCWASVAYAAVLGGRRLAELAGAVLRFE
ncbi:MULTISPECIES: hypothetical protein [unclassified Crossiella]|uniref:hypothetical protein n=1 Tax=unclassified Crossiella TaxID=2620835 RepID=UPI001FFF7654|nr:MULTISPECIES: hypothetical protein [unclassified Crossiella]MCK2238660.1 hypothetical protein [Crossiella sp. S99.2]MCK2251770.1 hypothetical protein [Crossiella sp. S99.1]